MKWFVNLIKNFFRKTKLIEEPKITVENREKTRNDFVVMLKQTADLDYNDGNGYKIVKKLKLRDMV